MITTPEQMREAAARLADIAAKTLTKNAPMISRDTGVNQMFADLAATIRAIPIAPQPVAVTVNPLVWVADPDNEGDYGFFRAWAGVYCYEVGADVGWWWQEDAAVSMAAIGGFPSPELAKAAAQADYEARILSALTIHPADPLSDPRVKALVEATTDLLEIRSVWIDPHNDSDVRRARAALRAIGGEA